MNRSLAYTLILHLFSEMFVLQLKQPRPILYTELPAARLINTQLLKAATRHLLCKVAEQLTVGQPCLQLCHRNHLTGHWMACRARLILGRRDTPKMNTTTAPALGWGTKPRGRSGVLLQGLSE